MDKKIIQKAGKYYTQEERHKIIQEFLSSRCSKVEIWKKYTGKEEEHGQLLRWMRELGYNSSIRSRMSNFTGNIPVMARNKTTSETQSSEDFETLQLKKRIAELENQLKDAEMKAIAFSTMVDIAEKEFKIPIRKKLNTKP